MVHGSGPMDASHHSSPFCAWMCSAASAVHSANAVPERPLFLRGIQPQYKFESASEKPFEDSPNIRPPPDILS
jgi:hypothetical protein